VSREVRKWAPWLVMLVVLVIALVIGTVRSSGPQTNADRVMAIARTLKCPVCDGESVAESNADASLQIRADIAKRLDQGQTADQIRAYYASPEHYGPGILLTPSSSGVSSLVWSIPVIVLVISLAVLVTLFRRWKVRGDVHATDADRDLVGAALGNPVPPDPEPEVDGEDDDEQGSGR
jgi:cytochrome c-type biogenesis protein CcmH